jgi:hypothetical protein
VTRSRASLIVLCVCLTGHQLFARQRTTPPRDVPRAAVPGASVIRGSVVDAETGAPIRRAIVRVSATEGPANHAIFSDGAGRFEFVDLPPGKYTLGAIKAGYLHASYGERRYRGAPLPIELTRDRAVDGIKVPLNRGGVIVGRVFDESGEPASDVEVRALQYRYDGDGRRLGAANIEGASTTSDDLGGFRLYGLPAGVYYVAARETNVFAAAMTPVSAAPSVARVTTFFPSSTDPSGAQRITVINGRESEPITVNLAVAGTSRIRGRVMTSTGESLADAQVNLDVRDALGGYGGGGGTSVRHDDGTFEFPRLPAGTYQLTAMPSSARWDGTDETGHVMVTVSGEDVNDVLLVTGKPAIARGRVVSDDGTLLPLKPQDVLLSVAPVATESAGLRRGGGGPRVAPDHSFEYTGLLGRQVLRFNSRIPGWSLKAVLLKNADVTDTGIDFPTNGGVVDGIQVVVTREERGISGAVTNERGEMVPDTMVLVFPADDRLWTWQSRFLAGVNVSPAGEYRIRMLPPRDDYLIVALPFEELELGQWRDPAFLRSVRDRATRISLGSTENKVLHLQVRAR